MIYFGESCPNVSVKVIFHEGGDCGVEGRGVGEIRCTVGIAIIFEQLMLLVKLFFMVE